MARCAATNLTYMRATPAGRAGYGAVVDLYHRLAVQGQTCAEAWEAGQPCPSHEPAVDAFWWGVAAWANAFCADVMAWLAPYNGRRLHHELQEVFCRPHREFAQWLRPLGAGSVGTRVITGYSPRVPAGRPAQLILCHDAAWTGLVIRLTAMWGLVRHLKDLRALWQSLRLVRRLRGWPDPVARAYLESDLAFFRGLFGHFPFTPRLRSVLDCFLEAADEELAGG